MVQWKVEQERSNLEKRAREALARTGSLDDSVISECQERLEQINTDVSDDEESGWNGFECTKPALSATPMRPSRHHIGGKDWGVLISLGAMPWHGISANDQLLPIRITRKDDTCYGIRRLACKGTIRVMQIPMPRGMDAHVAIEVLSSSGHARKKGEAKEESLPCTRLRRDPTWCHVKERGGIRAAFRAGLVRPDDLTFGVFDDEVTRIGIRFDSKSCKCHNFKLSAIGRKSPGDDDDSDGGEDEQASIIIATHRLHFAIMCECECCNQKAAPSSSSSSVRVPVSIPGVSASDLLAPSRQPHYALDRYARKRKSPSQSPADSGV